MFPSLLTPPLGYRTYRLLQMALVAGVVVAVLGIVKGSDLVGLAALEVALLAPVAASAAYKSGKEAAASTPRKGD